MIHGVETKKESFPHGALTLCGLSRAEWAGLGHLWVRVPERAGAVCRVDCPACLAALQESAQPTKEALDLTIRPLRPEWGGTSKNADAVPPSVMRGIVAQTMYHPGMHKPRSVDKTPPSTPGPAQAMPLRRRISRVEATVPALDSTRVINGLTYRVMGVRVDVKTAVATVDMEEVLQWSQVPAAQPVTVGKAPQSDRPDNLSGLRGSNKCRFRGCQEASYLALGKTHTEPWCEAHFRRWQLAEKSGAAMNNPLPGRDLSPHLHAVQLRQPIGPQGKEDIDDLVCGDAT